MFACFNAKNISVLRSKSENQTPGENTRLIKTTHSYAVQKPETFDTKGSNTYES
jgi:hypothetical protein